MIKFPDLPGYSSDYVKSVLDEIALEGLDGIALNDLWTRLLKRPHFCPQPIDEAAKIFLWDVVRRLRSVEFYQLPEPRPPLVIYDRFEHIDPDLGMVIEPAEVPVDIYPNCKVEDLKKGIIGSCSTYETREDMTGLIRTLDYKDVEERWGHKLVVVASQTARRNALLNQDVNPNLELTPLQYLIMERVGRSRYHGEITQGRDGLQLICEDAKSLFYLRKILHKHRLITKQVFHHKVGAQNLSGLLLHLPRFFVERKPKALDVMEKIATYLKTKPNHMEEHNVLRQTLSLGTTLKKIIQAHNFQKFVKSEHVLYRVMYPEATEVDWRYKGQNKERLVRVLYLVDPNMDIKDLWQKYETMYEDDDDDKYGILSSESHRLLDRTLLDQAYAVLEKVGPDGMSQVALGNALGMDKLLSRSILRNLTRLKKVTVFMKDEKKQRTARYTLKKFEKSSTMRNQVFEEKDKLMKLVDKKKSKNVKPSITDTNQLFEKSVEFENSTLSDDLVQGSDTSLAEGKSKSTLGTRKTTGGLQKSTKVSCTKKRKLSETNNLVSQVSPQTKKKKPATKTKKTNGNELNSPVENAEHTFNKVVSTGAIELKEVKPDMKLISKTLKSSNLLTNTDPGIETSTVSFRLLKRTNMILEAVRKQKVIFDTSKLQKMIYEEEVKEGYEARMDKKSLLRIIHKLALDKLVQHLEITLRANNREKILRFVCDPTVSHDHSVIQSAIDQAKMKLDILGKESMKRKQRQKNKSSKPGTKESAADESLQNTDDHKNEEDDFSLKYNGRVGRMYGFKPKYMRMQVLHKYMFYLVYGYEGTEELDQKQALVEIRHQITLSDDVQKEMSQIYTPSLDWQMFLPPLPLHMGYPEGWALMSDILLRLPLSIFVQVVNVSYEVPGMEEYLNHPIKKHFLVKNLPAPLKTACTYARKYIFAIHEQVVRLCFTGLLQLGPQRLKEKDQVFVYMNRRALLWDTISSPCGYFQIAKDKNYPVHKYHFQTADDVEQYWHDFWNYCVHTILGGRLSQSGQVVVVEGVQTKPVMLEAVEPRSVDEAPMRDVGYIPGDHLGAAGVDSAMFAHLKRNWYWNPLKTNFGSMINSQTAPSTELQLMVKLPECQNQEKKPLRVISETSSARRRGKRLKRQHGELKEGQRIAKRKLKVKRTVRTLKNRVLSRRKPYYDQTDREALLKMSKLRVDWTSKEDNLLLLCKVAIIIFQFIGRRYQNFVTVRQILHEQCPESIDKTSRACQRRLNYIMKNSHTQRSVNLCVEEMKQDKVVMRKLQDFIDMMVGDGRSRMSLEQRETQLAGKYKQLVLLLQVRYKELHHQNLSCLNEGFVLPDTVQELLKDYRILRPKSVQKKDFNDIHNVQDIYSGVIHSTIMSSLNCVGDKTSWAYQLFNIYQQYPDKLLRAMMTKTRADRMVSLRKHYMRKQMLSGDYLPLSSSPYQLSIRYINMLLTRYQFELYSACHDTYKGFASEDKYREVVASQGGEAACVIELLSTDQIDFKLNIPSQIIVMDPNVIKKDETYSRIVKRYQDILAKCKDTELVPTTAIFDQSFNISQDWSGEEVSKPTNNTVAKAASRIALYFTRDEYEKSENSCVVQNEMQHAHDFFVLNATKVFSKLIKNKINDKEEMQSLNPMPAATVSGLIKRIKRMAVFPNKVPSDMEVATKVSCRLGVHQELVLNLLDLIKAKKELGVTTDKIREKYGADPEVYRVLCALVDHQVCLCTGVIKTHFVHAEFHRPWIIRSHHLVRSEKDQITDADHQTFGMMIQFGKTDPNSDDVADPQLGTVAATLELTREASRSTSPVLSSLVYEPTPSTSSAPTPLLPITSFPDCPSEKQELKTVRYFNRKIKRIPVIEAKSKKDLNVCMRPWIRVNGSLNRRVLDKFLTSVLGHVMLVPLCSLQTVQERFSPAFQPHHTRELVEMLVELKCLQIIAVQQSEKPGLFSKPSKVTTYAATGLEREEDLLLEPDTMAITRLALFIGDSTYHRDIFSRDSSKTQAS